MKQYMVNKSYQAAFENPIKVSTGDTVVLGKVDDEYPAWIWCTTADGNSGWGPKECLEIDGSQGRFVSDYDATELKADEGTWVTGMREVGGWVWCRTEEGKEGWVPGKNLGAIG